MGRVSIIAVALVLMASSAAQAQSKRSGMRFWNLTLYTLTSLQFSPTGQDKWGPNQCLNDDDKTVDHDERLRITSKPINADELLSLLQELLLLSD